MLSYDANKRPTLERILDSNWLNGKKQQPKKKIVVEESMESEIVYERSHEKMLINVA